MKTAIFYCRQKTLEKIGLLFVRKLFFIIFLVLLPRIGVIASDLNDEILQGKSTIKVQACY